MKSSFCNSGTCVEAVIDPIDLDGDPLITVKDADGNEAYFHKDEWEAFIAGVKNNEFEVEKLLEEAHG